MNKILQIAVYALAAAGALTFAEAASTKGRISPAEKSGSTKPAVKPPAPENRPQTKELPPEQPAFDPAGVRDAVNAAQDQRAHDVGTGKATVESTRESAEPAHRSLAQEGQGPGTAERTTIEETDPELDALLEADDTAPSSLGEAASGELGDAPPPQTPRANADPAIKPR